MPTSREQEQIERKIADLDMGVAEKGQGKREQSPTTTFCETEGWIAEEILDPSLSPSIQFAVYDKTSGVVSLAQELVLPGGSRYAPLAIEMVKDRQIKLPSGVGDFTSDAELVSEIEEFVTCYLDLPHEFYLKLVCHYILLSWVFDRLSVVPYLRAFGDYGSGKTRFAQVVGSLCYKPVILAGATSDAFLFRVIELIKGTMILNELERVNTDMRSQITIILNNGYEKGMPIGRVEGDRVREPRLFDVYSPKIITSREKFTDLALESRILSVPMRPTKRKDITPLLNESFDQRSQVLRNKLLGYRFHRLSQPLDFSAPEGLDRVEPRLRQTLLPLFFVVQDDGARDAFLQFAEQFQKQVFDDRSTQLEAVVAEKLVQLLESEPQLTVGRVTQAVNEGVAIKEQLTSHKVGRIIRSFGFHSIKIGGTRHIQNNAIAVEYLNERYNLQIESPQSQQSPALLNRSEHDLKDLVDSNRLIKDMSQDEQLALGKQIFGSDTNWVEG